MKAGRLIAMGKPQELYNHPKNGYVASLFGEVNELPAGLFFKDLPSRKKVILYPHEIQITDTGKHKAVVRNNFFKGSHFLIEVEMEGQMIFIEDPAALKEGESIHLSFNPDILEKRIR
jgi:ABC-type Fe3+/spermidine/putrescine transport system ATPase subunit